MVMVETIFSVLYVIVGMLTDVLMLRLLLIMLTMLVMVDANVLDALVSFVISKSVVNQTTIHLMLFLL